MAVHVRVVGVVLNLGSPPLLWIFVSCLRMEFGQAMKQLATVRNTNGQIQERTNNNNTYTHIHVVHMHIHIHIYMYTDTYVYIYTYTYTHIHPVHKQIFATKENTHIHITYVCIRRPLGGVLDSVGRFPPEIAGGVGRGGR